MAKPLDKLIAEMTDAANPHPMMYGVGVSCNVVAGWRDQLSALSTALQQVTEELTQAKKDIAEFWTYAANAWDIETREEIEALAAKMGCGPLFLAAHHTWKRNPKVAALREDRDRLKEALVLAQHQLRYLWLENGSCPCGARRLREHTHPHVLGCPTEAALSQVAPFREGKE